MRSDQMVGDCDDDCGGHRGGAGGGGGGGGAGVKWLLNLRRCD